MPSQYAVLLPRLSRPGATSGRLSLAEYECRKYSPNSEPSYQVVVYVIYLKRYDVSTK